MSCHGKCDNNTNEVLLFGSNRQKQNVYFESSEVSTNE